MLNVKIKKLHPDAVIPFYSKKGDAGMDLTAIESWFDLHGNNVYRTGLSIEIPQGYVGLIYPRSSVSKTDLMLTNSVAVIDSGYRGELILKFRNNYEYANIISTIEVTKNNHSDKFSIMGLNDYRVGDKLAQLIIMPYPEIQFEEVSELSETLRGDGGFGSTGK